MANTPSLPTALYLLVTALGCANAASRQELAKLPTCLMVPDGARDVYPSFERDGRISVTYTLNTPYPADHILSSIEEALRGAGWTPLLEDFLNPGLRSSHVRGWTQFGDASRPPPTEVHQWLGDWTDSSGNVLVYALQYRSQFDASKQLGGTPDNANLTVTALFVPKVVADAMKRASVH